MIRKVFIAVLALVLVLALMSQPILAKSPPKEPTLPFIQTYELDYNGDDIVDCRYSIVDFIMPENPYGYPEGHFICVAYWDIGIVVVDKPGKGRDKIYYDWVVIGSESWQEGVGVIHDDFEPYNYPFPE